MKRIVSPLALIAVLFVVSACKKKEAAKVEDDYVFKIGFTMSLCNALVHRLANGLPVQLPLAMHTDCIKVLVRGDSSINTTADLKGKTIGGASPSVSALLFTRRYLAAQGFTVDGENADVEYLYQSAGELPLLLGGVSVDAIAITDPSGQIARDTRGFRSVIDNGTDEGYKNEFCCVVPVRTATIKEHPQATAKFLRALQKGAKFVQENPDEAAQILALHQRIAGDPAGERQKCSKPLAAAHR